MQDATLLKILDTLKKGDARDTNTGTSHLVKPNHKKKKKRNAVGRLYAATDPAEWFRESRGLPPSQWVYRTDKTFWRRLFGGRLRQLCRH